VQAPAPDIGGRPVAGQRNEPRALVDDLDAEVSRARSPQEDSGGGSGTQEVRTSRLTDAPSLNVDLLYCYGDYMTQVGVRELKQRLSEYLERAERGEVIQVTDRGRPKAILGPLPGLGQLQEGIADGWVTLGSGAPLGPVIRAHARTRVLDALDEDRGT